MDMTDDKTVPEGLHGTAENVAADGLDDILHEFRTVGFNAFPFLCRTDAFICDGFPAEPVLTDTGFYIGQVTA